MGSSPAGTIRAMNLNREQLLDVLAAHAEAHGRSVDEEVTLALAIHVANHGIALLRDEHGREEARLAGYDPEADAESFRHELTRLCDLAFEPPRLFERLH